VIDVLERGDIAFFYRPTVRAAGAPPGPDGGGVQRFFFVLIPADGPARRLRVGRKRLPSRPGQRFWVEIERVGSLDDVLVDQLEDDHYTTRTRGERYQPGARPVAQGCYAFVRHGDHCHLAYRIDRAEPADEVPEDVRVPDAASYVVLTKAAPGSSATWTASGVAGLPDRRGAQLVLAGAVDEPEGTLGVDILPPAD
jgi:hypothetical protein